MSTEIGVRKNRKDDCEYVELNHDYMLKIQVIFVSTFSTDTLQFARLCVRKICLYP